jgi:rare lipoprotein A
MKSYLEIIGAFIAVSALAVAAMWVAPAKADPLSDFLDAVFQQQASLPPYHAHWRRIHARPPPVESPAGAAPARSMLASYYGGGAHEGLNAYTACGARFNPWGLTAAHRSLRCGAKLLVSRGARAVVVTVNDRGPAAWTGRSLDVSRGAAMRLAMLEVGVARVNVQVLQ